MLHSELVLSFHKMSVEKQVIILFREQSPEPPSYRYFFKSSTLSNASQGRFKSFLPK